jgi:hypothetical protein
MDEARATGHNAAMRIAITNTQPESLAATIPPQYRKAAAVALTRVAWDVREGLMAGMQQSFDRPNPFTMRAFRVDAATATESPQAVVWAAPQQAKYLFWQIEGGQRRTKGFEARMGLQGGEVALPTDKATRDAYGNMPLSFIKRVAGDKNSSGKDKRFFIGTPKGGDTEGVWARVSGNKRLVPLMLFANEAQYRERFDMSAIAGRVVDARFESQLMRALQASKV